MNQVNYSNDHNDDRPEIISYAQYTASSFNVTLQKANLSSWFAVVRSRDPHLYNTSTHTHTHTHTRTRVKVHIAQCTIVTFVLTPLV